MHSIKPIFFYLLGVSAFASSIAITAPATGAVADEIAYVQVRETKARSQAKIWAPVVASLSYGDSVTKVGEDGGWSSIKIKNKNGFIPTSSLTERQVILASKNAGAGSGIDPTDAVLAGKGFDKATESQFASTGKGNFALVNQVEKIKVSDGELREFVVAGKLEGGK